MLKVLRWCGFSKDFFLFNDFLGVLIQTMGFNNSLYICYIYVWVFFIVPFAGFVGVFRWILCKVFEMKEYLLLYKFSVLGSLAGSSIRYFLRV